MTFDDALARVRVAYQMGREGRSPRANWGDRFTIAFGRDARPWSRHEWAAWRLGFWHRGEGIR